MKIVMHCRYTGPAKNGMGTERVVEALTKGLLSLGHEVVMFVNPDSTNMPAPIVNKIPKDFDIVHDHGSSLCVLNSFGIPWCSTIHGGGSDPVDIYWRNNENFILVSKFIADMSNIKNANYVHSCIDPSDFIYKEKKDNYFLWIASTDWGEGKGLFTAIRLAKKMKFKLKVAGTGKNLEIIDQLKIYCTDNVEYLGGVNGIQKAELIANAKALLFYTKLPDACPLTVAETAISGTPIIGSTMGSLPELIVDGKTGILCSSEQELVKAVANINKIKPKDCREYALQNFTHIEAAKKHLKYYEEAIKRYKK